MFSSVNCVSDAIFYLFISDMYFLYSSKGLEELSKQFVKLSFRRKTSKFIILQNFISNVFKVMIFKQFSDNIHSKTIETFQPPSI